MTNNMICHFYGMVEALALEAVYEAKHRAPKVASGQMPPPLRPRGHPAMRYDERYTPYLRQAGLLAFSTVCQRGMPTFNAPALTALVDKWRPETHSFHLPCGEMTITLQDVAMILGLPIRGHAVTGTTASAGWRERVVEMLGIAPEPPSPPAKESKTSGVSLKWLEDNFQDLPADAGEAQVQRHARAYVLHLFGAVLFPDSAGDMASWMFLPLLRDFTEAGAYSWGSAALGWLYRQLCYACQRTRASSCLAGCVFLLQIWMWMRLPVGRPAWVRLTDLYSSSIFLQHQNL